MSNKNSNRKPFKRTRMSLELIADAASKNSNSNRIISDEMQISSLPKVVESECYGHNSSSSTTHPDNEGFIECSGTDNAIHTYCTTLSLLRLIRMYRTTMQFVM